MSDDLAEEPYDSDELCIDEGVCLFPECCTCSTQAREIVSLSAATRKGQKK